jgi:hypothetical protein
MNTPLDISTPKIHFGNFLNSYKNERIIFSGIFGIGKTYFLNEFFKDHNKYLPVHLFPTNYSVSTNEDIFELIKYDVLYKILEYKPQLDKLETGTFESLAYIDAEDIYKIFKGFIEIIPEIGKKTLDIIEPLEVLFKALQAKKNELKIDEGESLKKFAEKIHMSKGSIYEYDFYTELIVKLVLGLKEKTNKEIVLIVDDLDRIDPEHIFRILNIFAVHFDVNNRLDSKNKFEIDKVILCCDVQNIKRIFTNRYGIEVDFNGYIDKFYTSEIYYFNNKKVITDVIEKFIRQIKVTNIKVPAFQNGYIYFLNCILYSMIYSNTLNLRTLKSWHGRTVTLDESICVLSHTGLSINTIQIIEVFALLTKIFGSTAAVLEVLKKSRFSPLLRYTESLRPLGDLVLICQYENHRFDLTGSYTFKEGMYDYFYTIKEGNTANGIVYYADINKINTHSSGVALSRNDGSKIHFKDLLVSAYEIYLNKLL